MVTVGLTAYINIAIRPKISSNTMLLVRIPSTIKDFSIGQVQGANPMASTASPLPAINLAVSILVNSERGVVSSVAE
ncbi:hypothetical protein HJC23_003745 [Cyclotella cryptica]|uniref:Uncharacterized protein n=1 Tax=Cyclotella cryptica TaxID=29204 RepID=A0ABD3QVP2_9STRA